MIKLAMTVMRNVTTEIWLGVTGLSIIFEVIHFDIRRLKYVEIGPSLAFELEKFN